MKGILLLSLVSIIAIPKECLARPEGLDTGAVPQLVDQLLGTLLGGNVAGTPNGGITAMARCAQTINDMHKAARKRIRKIIRKNRKKCKLTIVIAHVNTLDDRIKETSRQLLQVGEVTFIEGLPSRKNGLKELPGLIRAAIGKLSEECQPKCNKIFVLANNLVNAIIKILDNLKSVLKETKTKQLLG